MYILPRVYSVEAWYCSKEACQGQLHRTPASLWHSPKIKKLVSLSRDSSFAHESLIHSNPTQKTWPTRQNGKLPIFTKKLIFEEDTNLKVLLACMDILFPIWKFIEMPNPYQNGLGVKR
jgi:hypothetical protein